jgi:hypothetical protein
VIGDVPALVLHAALNGQPVAEHLAHPGGQGFGASDRRIRSWPDIDPAESL